MKNVAQHKNMAMGDALNKSPSAVAKYKKGGSVHSDVKEDRAMVKQMVKPSALTGKKRGGKC